MSSPAEKEGIFISEIPGDTVMEDISDFVITGNAEKMIPHKNKMIATEIMEPIVLNKEREGLPGEVAGGATDSTAFSTGAITAPALV